jgi:hypothetical protein
VGEAVDENSYLEPADLSMAAYHATGDISIYKSASENAGPFSASSSPIEDKQRRSTPEFLTSIEDISLSNTCAIEPIVLAFLILTGYQRAVACGNHSFSPVRRHIYVT